jgi:hypothetical protein
MDTKAQLLRLQPLRCFVSLRFQAPEVPGFTFLLLPYWRSVDGKMRASTCKRDTVVAHAPGARGPLVRSCLEGG